MAVCFLVKKNCKVNMQSTALYQLPRRSTESRFLKGKALFSSQKLVKKDTVALSFLFDKHCSIIE